MAAAAAAADNNYSMLVHAADSLSSLTLTLRQLFRCASCVSNRCGCRRRRASCRPSVCTAFCCSAIRPKNFVPMYQVRFLREQLAWLPQTPGELPPFLVPYADAAAAANGGAEDNEVVITD